VPLALCGLLLLWQRTTTDDRRPTTDRHKPESVVGGQWSVVVLMLGTLVIALLTARHLEHVISSALLRASH